MAPNSYTAAGAVLPVDDAGFLDLHVWPGVAGAYFPGVPVEIAGDVDEFRAAVELAGAPLEIDEFEFEIPVSIDEARAKQRKRTVKELLEDAGAAGVDEEQLEKLGKPGVSKDQIIDAIAAVADPKE